MRPIDESYRSLLQYLQNYSLGKVLPKRELQSQLKMLHKHVYALLCWQVELRPSLRTNLIWFNETVSDLIQVCSFLAQGHYKVCKVMHRSAIENFMKFIVSQSGASIPEGGVFRLFEVAKEVSVDCWGMELKTRADELHATYGELCNYVHTSNESYCAFSETLGEYPAYDHKPLLITNRELVKSLHIMNACMTILEPMSLRQMYYLNKDAVLDCLSAAEKRVLAG